MVSEHAKRDRGPCIEKAQAAPDEPAQRDRSLFRERPVKRSGDGATPAPGIKPAALHRRLAGGCPNHPTNAR